jgi:hypothetical protein
MSGELSEKATMKAKAVAAAAREGAAAARASWRGEGGEEDAGEARSVSPQEPAMARVNDALAGLQRSVDEFQAVDYQPDDPAASRTEIEGALIGYIAALRSGLGDPELGQPVDRVGFLIRDVLNAVHLAGVREGRSTEPGEPASS